MFFIYIMTEVCKINFRLLFNDLLPVSDALSSARLRYFEIFFQCFIWMYCLWKMGCDFVILKINQLQVVNSAPLAKTVLLPRLLAMDGCDTAGIQNPLLQTNDFLSRNSEAKKWIIVSFWFKWECDKVYSMYIYFCSSFLWQ